MADNLPVPEPSWYTSIIQGTTAIPNSVAKLIDTIGAQIGLFLEPTHIRRKGKAEADVTVAKAKAAADSVIVELKNRLVVQDIQDRADERIRRRETKRQKNIEAIAAQAARELPESASEEPVDDDWITQFFNHCQDVSNEQMQHLWARLLAGEVVKPGSFSLRTLALVQVMNTEDADIFTRFCSMLWDTPQGLTPIVPDLDKVRSMPGVEMEFMDFVRLQSLGLITLEAIAGFALNFIKSHGILLLIYSRQQHVLRTQDAQRLPVGKALLTEVGKELAVIAGSSPNEEYRSWVVSNFREQGWKVEELPPWPGNSEMKTVWWSDWNLRLSNLPNTP
jgi:hypothetical protein